MEGWSYFVGTVLAVLASRLWSMWEHRDTKRKVDGVYAIANGERERLLAENAELRRRLAEALESE